MEPNKIKDADFLDILFEGRNKDYGAYDLRKTYNRRIGKALLVTGSVIVLLFIGSYVAGRKVGVVVRPPEARDVDLLAVKEPDKPLPVPAPKPIQQVATIRIVTPRIVPDRDVKPDEKPPENDKVDDDVKIGTINQDGIKGDVVAGPPSDGGKGIVAEPKHQEEDDGIVPVEIESSFPGGLEAWKRFLNKNLRFPDDAQNNEIQGMVMVQFVVDKDGNVSDVQAISGPEKGGLREEAVRVIKKSGKWTPGMQNGRYVKSYKRQPVTFVIGNE